MSADVWIECGECASGGRGPGHANEGSVNIAYDLSPMLHKAGFVGWQALVVCYVRMLETLVERARGIGGGDELSTRLHVRWMRQDGRLVVFRWGGPRA